MTRYVLDDLEQVAAELSRRAAELTRWLDASAADVPVPMTAAAPGGEPGVAEALGQLDQLCHRALATVADRLTAAAEAVITTAADMRGVDVEVAARLARWTT